VGIADTVPMMDMFFVWAQQNNAALLVDSFSNAKFVPAIGISVENAKCVRDTKNAKEKCERKQQTNLIF